MGYLADITKQIKQGQDVIFVGTGIILVDENNKIFIACRSDNKQWCLPGGSLEIGESLEECIVRETEEETGVKVNIKNIHLNAAKAILEPINKNGVPIYVVSISYWTNDYDDIDLQLDSKEFTKYGWVTLDEIDKLSSITPYSRIALDVFKKNKKANLIEVAKLSEVTPYSRVALEVFKKNRG